MPQINAGLSSELTIRTVGYHRWSTEEIDRAIRAGEPERLIEGDGNFIIAVEDGRGHVWIITSFLGVCNYYYTVTAAGMVHGPEVFGVWDESGRDWEWNWRAVADVIEFEQVFGQETLHPRIWRTPPASVVHFDGTEVHITSVPLPTMEVGQEVAGDMTRAFTHELELWAGDSNVVSASAGFDSRCILAGLLSLGIRPALLVMGGPECTDRQAAEHLARIAKLDLDVVEFTLHSYMEFARSIVTLTNGTKPAEHWHTYVYPVVGNVGRNDMFFVGSNGEYARSFYLDLGIGAQIAEFSPVHLIDLYWTLRRPKVFSNSELNALHPKLRFEMSPQGWSERRRRLRAMLASNTLMPALDEFYLKERVRQFIGNGLALYDGITRWIAPFLSRAWVMQAKQLKRGWKIDSAWHRYAIAQLQPELLEVPEERSNGQPMSATRRRGYWLRKGARSTPYFDYNSEFRRNEWLEFVGSHGPYMSDWIDAQALKAMLEKHRLDGSRRRAVSTLATLGVWSELVARPS